MADMNTMTTSIANTSYDLRLLEADIATLTFSNRDGEFQHNDAFFALSDAIGLNWNLLGGARMPGLFWDMLRPKAEAHADYSFTIPTGKTLLALAAYVLQNESHPWPELTIATLALSLKGAGLDLVTAAGRAQTIARSSPGTTGGRNYVQSVLVPQILNAAAAA